MANNTDIVKEIEEAVEKLVDIYEEDDPKCDFGVYRMRTGKVVGDTISTLQRARDALRWIPIEEWSRPTKESNHYEVTVLTDIERRTMGRRILFWNAVTGRWHDLDDQAMRYPTRYPVVAVKEPSAPYTPEEK